MDVRTLRRMSDKADEASVAARWAWRPGRPDLDLARERARDEAYQARLNLDAAVGGHTGLV